MRKIINLIFGIYCLTNALPCYSLTFEEAKNEARAINQGGYSGVISQQNKESTPGYVTDNPEEVKYFDGNGADEDAKNKIENSEEGQLITQIIPNRPKTDINHSSSFLGKAREIENNPDEVVNMMMGNYDECKPITEEVHSDFEIKTCDEYEEVTSNSCFVGQIFNIDDDHKYKCNEKRAYQDKSCDNNLALTCSNYSVCNQDIKLATVSGQGSSYSYPNLNVDIPWTSGGCSIYIRITNVFIEDPDLIDSFILSQVSWDDSVEIKINGKSVFRDWWGCERGRVFHNSPNKDIKSYLVKGNNVIELKLSVSGRGFASTKYILKQKCCNSFEEKWEEICPN